MFSLFRKWKRRRLAKREFPPQWDAILKAEVPFFSRLSPSQQSKLKNDLKVFAWEKYFIGAGGFEVTDTTRVVISACAARLVLGLDMTFYDRLTEVVVYPDDYKHPDSGARILGEAQQWGTVVLSWRAVTEGLRAPTDGQNTAMHEFAHVLDRADGAFDGTPHLHAHEHYRPWAEIMDHHYQRLRKRNRKQRSVMDVYGGTNEAEFFAVASEVFFEDPNQMQKKLPKLYEELKGFYDPGESD